MIKNPIPPYNFDIIFSINSITASKESNQILFSKCTGQFSGQFIFNEVFNESNSRKNEEILKETENF